MQLVFLIFIDSLFRWHHSLVFTNFSLISFSNCRIKGDEAKTLVSSAKIQKFNLAQQLEMSFIQSKKKRRSRELPCGVPHFIVCFDDSINAIKKHIVAY